MTAILQPVIALAAWTMVMWLWMYATRLPAMAKAGIDPNSLADDPDASLDRALSPRTQWKAHNYNHLHEAPTVFYAVMLALALLSTQTVFVSTDEDIIAWLGWAYVAVRIVHSLVQATINRVKVRFAVFALSSLILIALIAMAGLAVF